MMHTRKLGYTDLELTTVGLGAWAIGGPWLYGWGPQDDDASIATLLRAIDEGINWIDTAAIYGHGRSETVVGRALKQMSPKPLIATKCGLCWDEQNERIPRLKAQSIRTECHDSLRRLDIESIDLYQIHFNEPDEDIEEGWTEMTKLVEDGSQAYELIVCELLNVSFDEDALKDIDHFRELLFTFGSNLP